MAVLAESQGKTPSGWSRAPADGGVLRRKCACGNHTVAGKECMECSRKKQSLQRKATEGPEGSEVPSIVHDVLRSPGQPLDGATRAFMELRFGHDFSQVRVHTEAKAAASASAVNALAYTAGREVVFETGKYAPGTATGRRLLAHELAHVVQGGDSVARSPRGISQADEPLEAEADRVADAVMSESPTLPRLQHSVALSHLMRAIAYDADCQPDQDEVQGNVSRAQASAARWARAALASLARPENAGSLLRRHFNVEATNAAQIGRVRGHFDSIAGALGADAFTYHCRPDSDARCRSADGKEIAGFAYPGRSDIFFCDPYPLQNFFGHRSLIDTLLHESAHAHDASFNHDTYEWQDAYPGRSPLTNADSYSSFARDAALGREGVNLELSVGGLMAADPQFYIAAGVSGEVGGPALDLFNLKLAYRLAFLPGTERQPARGFQEADIGLRINPIGQRVYVDVTTGAFMGINFTDTELMAGIANRISAGYRGERLDFGLDLNHLHDFVGDRNLVIIGVRTGVRF